MRARERPEVGIRASTRRVFPARTRWKNARMWSELSAKTLRRKKNKPYTKNPAKGLSFGNRMKDEITVRALRTVVTAVAEVAPKCLVSVEKK